MLWWLSFCDTNLPKGSQFLGACIVRGVDIIGAANAAHKLGCNPGGEIQGQPIDDKAVALIDPKWINRLLIRVECEEFDSEMSQKILS